MKERVDNYKIQAEQAKKHFLTYDQQELIGRCGLRYDDTYLYAKFLSKSYRIHRKTGDMERLEKENWVEASAFGMFFNGHIRNLFSLWSRCVYRNASKTKFNTNKAVQTQRMG